MCSGWAIYERLVLFSCIYAADHHMIPVVDMKNYKSIYQEKEEFQKVNVWDRYYLQPGGVSLEKALANGNYVFADPSYEWFTYIRRRKPQLLTKEFLRSQYSKYIKLQPDVIEICENRLASIIPDGKTDQRLIDIVLRGTDYLKYHHAVQPEVDDIVKLAQKIFEEYRCDYYFIAAEGYSIFRTLKKKLPISKMISYKSGNVKDIDGYVGKYISDTVGAEDASLDYLTILYILNKCCCLVGGKCGATQVAKYRKNPPYEYINIIDMHKNY